VKLILMPYKQTSAGSKMMAKRLNVSRVLRDGELNIEEDVACINWGRGDFPHWGHIPKKWINSPEAVLRSIDKLRSFNHFRYAGVPTPPWTTSREEAIRWSLTDKQRVLARLETEGMDGAGIEVCEPGEPIPRARLYTMYVEKVAEYRVHVMNGECFYANQKRPNGAFEHLGSSQIICTSSNGWWFRHLDALPARRVQDACVAATKALGLDFCGVDVGVDALGNPYVYEVNTAPEMGPNTTEAYFRAFKRHYGQYKNNANVPLKDS
jgi:hypothetical protein